MTILLLALLRALVASDACGPRCGVLRQLPGSLFFNPWETLLQSTPRYVAFIFSSLLALYLLMTLLNGIASLGIRFVWVSLFPVQASGTVPQALLLMVVIALAGVIGLQWPLLNFVQPGYATFGGQTFCNATTAAQCEQDSSLVLPCLQAISAPINNLTMLRHDFSKLACHRSIVSQVVGSLVANYPWFGILFFWAQYGVVAIFLIALITAFVKRPSRAEPADEEDVDEETALLR